MNEKRRRKTFPILRARKKTFYAKKKEKKFKFSFSRKKNPFKVDIKKVFSS